MQQPAFEGFSLADRTISSKQRVPIFKKLSGLYPTRQLHNSPPARSSLDCRWAGNSKRWYRVAIRASSSTQADDGEIDIICRGYGLGFLELYSLFFCLLFFHFIQ